MTIEEKQRELDKAKWDKSVSLRFDACGSFNYCTNCNKNVKNPCANAYSKFFNEELEGLKDEPIVEAVEVVEEKPAKKTCAKKATTTKTATQTTTKKTAEKKTTTTKKTTTKKSTTK